MQGNAWSDCRANAANKTATWQVMGKSELCQLIIIKVILDRAEDYTPISSGFASPPPLSYITRQSLYRPAGRQ